MNKDLHDIDGIFNSAYREFEDNPAPGVWQKINEQLDKKEKEAYKRKFIGWKRTAILLLLLLVGFVLYESVVLKPVSGNINKNISVQNSKPSILLPGNSNTGNKPDEVVLGSSKPLIEQSQKNILSFNSTSLAVWKTGSGKKVTSPKNDPEIKLPDELTKVKKEESIGFLTNPDKNTNPLLVNKETQQENKTSLIPLTRDYSMSNTNERLPLDKVTSQRPAAKDTFLKNNSAVSMKQKKGNGFNHFWAISGFASYDFMNYRLENDLSTIKKIRQNEAHEPSFSTGFLSTRKLKKGWRLQTGFIYSNTQIGISPQKMYALQDPAGSVAYKYITSSGYAYIKPAFGSPPVIGDSLTTTEAKHTLQFVSVPVVIKHSFGKNKLTFIPGVGIEANFLMSAKLVTEIKDASNFENVSINKLNGTRSFYWSFTADAEIQYQVNKKMAISLRPAFRHAVTPITKNNAVETFPYSFGVGLGIKYRL